MSRYHSHFSQDKISASQARPSSGVGPGNKDGFREATANWPGAPGPKGPGINKLKWKEVKQSAKKDMADDMFGLELDPLAPAPSLGTVLNNPAAPVPNLLGAPPVDPVMPLPRVINNIPDGPSYLQRRKERRRSGRSLRSRNDD